MRRSSILALCLTACLGTDPVEDGADDPFLDGGKADGYGLSDAEVAGVLAVANTTSKATLQDDVGLSSRVATNITQHRAGADAKLDTADDDLFDDLQELDDVAYVGKRVFEALLAYARDHGYVHDGDGFCRSQHAGKTPSGAAVQLCDALYDKAPFVHLPADTATVFHGGILNGVGLTLYTADGRVLPIVNASGQTYPISHGPTGFKAPENLFAIYEVTGKLIKQNGSDAIRLDALKPIAWIPGVTQDKLLLGTWEMQAAGRVGTNQFDETKPVTVRFTLGTTTDNTPMWQHLGGGDGSIVAGAIDNFDHAATAADGSCLPSLASLGIRSPFYQATANKLTLWRHPNMHGLNDQVIVMDYPTGSADLSPNGMGYIGPFTPAGLAATAGPTYSDVQIRPHATPNGAKLWGFTKVTNGGAACH